MLRILLPYYIVFFVAVFVWPVWRMWRGQGTNPLVLPSNDSAEGFVGLWFKVLVGSVVALTLGLTLGLSPTHLGLIGWMEGAAQRWAGVAMLAVSLPLVALAQRTMGRSWRIGIDSEVATELVTHGLFAYSRNPIFLALRLNLAGLFLVLPTAATLAIWLLGEVLMGLQVRLEEAHLGSILGQAYTDYAMKTPRWI